jgi:hypothetical protein
VLKVGECDVLQRRCPLLTDEEALIDLAKSAKIDCQATLENTLDGFTLDDVATGTSINPSLYIHSQSLFIYYRLGVQTFRLTFSSR